MSTPKKILQINTVCGTGSTGKIAAGIMRLGIENDFDMYYAYGRGDNPNKAAARCGVPDDYDSSLHFFKIGNVWDFGIHVLSNFFRGNSGFASKRVTLNFLKWVDEIKPDIIHLHNIHGFYLNIELLFAYIKDKNIKVIWTLHDCWPFTGQCAFYDYADCSKWRLDIEGNKGCNNCPIYRSSYPYSLFKDNSIENFAQKRKCFSGVEDLTIVTPSKWLAGEINKSFLNVYPVKVIHNGIDTGIFSREEENKNEKLLDDRYIIGVANIWEARKGLDTFYQLAKENDFPYKIVLVGLSRKQRNQIINDTCFRNRIVPIERTANQNELARWYRGAEAFINPTFEDNFPTTNIEALACGTPVITYDTGGSSEALLEKGDTNNDKKHDFDDVKTGLAIQKGNYRELYKNIIKLYNKEIHFDRENCKKRGCVFSQEEKLIEYIYLYNN